MTAVYLFTGLLVLLLVLGLVVGPLLEREPVSDEGDAPPEARQDAELEALQEVEFEYETGKLSEEDYRELRTRHARAAVEARREAQAERGDGSGEAPAGTGGATAEGAADGAAPAGEAGRTADGASGVARAASGASGAGPAGEGASGGGPGGEGASAETPAEGPSPGTCASCGAALRPGASYCTSCGTRVRETGPGGTGTVRDETGEGGGDESS